VLTGIPSEELEDFVGTTFYCSHAQIREKMLELSLSVLPIPSPQHGKNEIKN